MVILKRILQIISVCILVLVLGIAGILLTDNQRTNYLKIANNPDFQKQTYVLKNIHIVPMDKDTVLSNQMIYIKDGYIEEIGQSIAVEDVTVIDGEHQFLLPGLIDMHVHVWDRYELGLYLASGITSVRNLWGFPMHLRIKKAIANNTLIGPLFYTSGPKLTGPDFIGDDNLNLYSQEEARELVKQVKEDGYDFIKTYYGLDKELYDAVIDEAKQQNLEIAAHPSQKVPFSYHLQDQIKTIEHAEEIVQQPLAFDLDTLQLQPIIDSLAAYEHTNYVPTLVVFHNIVEMMNNPTILSGDAMSHLNPLIRATDSKDQYNRWDSAKKQDSTVVERITSQDAFHQFIVKKMHQAGITIVCGTDAGIGVTPPGISIHQELAFFKEAGLTNYEVLKTATVNAAATHQLMGNQGVVKEGYLANLLLVKENPLENLTTLMQPSTVFVEGRKLNRAILSEFEQKAKVRKNVWATALQYAEYLLFVR